MNCLFFIGCILILFSAAYAESKGNSGSIIFESNEKSFNYKNITKFVTFGDSFTHIEKVNLDEMTYIEDTLSDLKWNSVMSKNNNMTLYNFAYGGAVIDRNIIPQSPFHSSFLLQYDQFIERMSEGKKFGNWNGNDTLFGFWFGTNDNLYLDRDTYDSDDKVKDIFKTIFETLFSKVNDMYNMGARNFLFIKAVNLNKFPQVKDGKSRSIRKKLEKTKGYINDFIIKNAENFHNNHNDTNIYVYGADNEYDYIMENYKQYNYTSNSEYYNKHGEKKGKDVNDYIWIDGLHSTPKTQRILAENIEYLLETGDTSGMIRTVTLLLSKMIICISFVIYILL